MSEDLIQNEIQKRKITYYPVSNSDLDSLQQQGNLGDVFKLFSSLSLSVIISGVLTKAMNPSLSEEPLLTINLIMGFSSISFLVFLIFSILFIIYRNKKIAEIKGKQPERYTVKEVQKQENPKYYVGNNQIKMNISVKHKDNFYQLLKSQSRYNLLTTSFHNNKFKTDYFTFIISNGNEHLFQEFQEFLKQNKIEFIDYH